MFMFTFHFGGQVPRAIGKPGIGGPFSDVRLVPPATSEIVEIVARVHTSVHVFQ